MNKIRILTHAEVLDRLRAYAAGDGVPALVWLKKHDRDVYRGVQMHFRGIAAARDAVGVAQPQPQPLVWSQGRVIEELRRIHLAGRVRITMPGLRKAGYSGLVGALVKYVGSMAHARRLAMIPEPGRRPADTHIRWDEDLVISAIRERHRNGEPLAGPGVPNNLYLAASRHCGSWGEAIEIAGFNWDEIRRQRRPRTPEEVLAWVTRAARARIENGEPRSMPQLTKPIAVAIRTFFGDLAGALRAANIEPASVLPCVPPDDRSNADLIAELRATLVQGYSPSTARRFLRTTPLGRVAVKRFGGVRAVIEQLGPDLWPTEHYRPTFSADEVVAGLQARHRRGDKMKLDPAMREEPRLVRGALRRFGTWQAAMQAAGLGALVGRSRLSAEEVIVGLQARHQRGDHMSYGATLRDESRLASAAKKRFGTWRAAMEAAGARCAAG